MSSLPIELMVFLGLLLCGGILLRWPELGLLAAVLLLYLNIPALAVQLYGAPTMAASATGALLLPGFLHSVTSRSPRVVLDVPLILMIVFLVAVLISSLWAVEFGLAQQWITTYLLEGVLLYFLIVNLVRSLRTLRRVAWVLLISGAILSTLTLYQEATNNYSNEFGGLAQRMLERETPELQAERLANPRAREKIYAAYRARGPVNEPNFYAQILIMLLPIGWFRIKDERTRALKLTAVACTLTIMATVLLTYSRGAFMAIVAILALLALFRSITVRQLVVGAVIFVAIAFVVAPGYTSRVLSLRALQALEPTSASVDVDIAARGRAAEMAAAWRVFQDYPVLGVGPGQFSKVYSLTYMSEMYQLKRITVSRRAHSLYLELAAETGVVGLSIFLALVAVMLQRLAKTWRRTRDQEPDVSHFALAFLIGIVAYLVTGLFLSLAYQRYFWLFFALAGATVHTARWHRAQSNVQLAAA